MWPNISQNGTAVSTLAAVLVGTGAAGCGAAPQRPASASPAPASHTAAPEPESPASLGDDPEAVVAPGRHTSPTSFEPPIGFTLRHHRGLHWYGAGFGNVDWQLREGRSSCDGCELGALEVLRAEGSPRRAIAELRRVPSLRRAALRPTRIDGFRGYRLAGRAGRRKIVVFDGYELGDVNIDASVVRARQHTLVIIATARTRRGNPFLRHARDVVRSFRIAGRS